MATHVARDVSLNIDVTDAVRFGEPAHVAVTVTLPDPSLLRDPPVVCFAKPGGGYSRKYFTIDLPGPGVGAQADWHAARGWIFVSIDHLGGGDSSRHADEKLGYTSVIAGSFAAEQEVLQRLAKGTLAKNFPQVRQPLTIGIGQSLGGCLTIAQQGRHHCYDGVAALGFSAVHTHPPSPPGDAPIVAPWVPRDVVELDLGHFDRESSDATRPPPPWSSLTQPDAVSQTCLTPGVVAPEAAAIRVPVLSAMGERDMVVDPAGEARAFKSTCSFDLFICPRMGHMHNFASTRALLWQRIERFAEWCPMLSRAGGSAV